ncbi:MAG: threonylcarbamoyl-AMP synthase [Acidobacteria bacterium]|nr:MAG: threonylcarbamoyl-AMP synthase [Acidobacteriota bacterium]
MNLVTATTEAIARGAKIIRSGGLVAFPTETVYGLGADAFNALAVARVFEVKNRPQFDPLIVHVADKKMVDELCTAVNDRARKLIDRFWPGPLTLVLPKRAAVPDIVTAGLPTVAVRMPAHPVALRLIEQSRTPIAAPSANPFGYLSPTSAEHVAEYLGDKVDLILDGGPCPIGVESTVLDVTQPEATVLRPGGLPVEEIERVIGEVRVITGDVDEPQSPGQLPRHYSPRTPIRILKAEEPTIEPGKNIGLLAFRKPDRIGPFTRVEVLSEKGDLREAAARFFSCLHRLDKAGLDIIYVEPVPEVGLGRAIMNRLMKAAGRP